jgi:hypothetical protein
MDSFLLSAAIKIKFTMKSVFLEDCASIMAHLTDVNSNMFHSFFEERRERHVRGTLQENQPNIDI